MGSQESCGGSCLPLSLAIASCAAMAATYVAFLYAPTLLRLPPPASLQHHMLRRFVSASLASLLALGLSYLLLPIRHMEFAACLKAYGLRTDHWWQAVVFPLLSIGMLYLGPLVMASIDLVSEWQEDGVFERCSSGELVRILYTKLVLNIRSLVSDVLAWRNYIVAPMTEEVVFRACMIPVLLCAGLGRFSIIFFCPLFFGLAHINHFWELVHQQKFDIKAASLIVGMRLVYTTIFGWYAAYLFLRTGHLLAPVVVHIFCNIMGLPSLEYASQKGGLLLTYMIGILGFFFMLSPTSNPVLFNNNFEDCSCWQGYCKWK